MSLVRRRRKMVQPLRATYEDTLLYWTDASTLTLENGLVLAHNAAAGILPWNGPLNVSETRRHIAVGTDPIPWIGCVLDRYRNDPRFNLRARQPGRATYTFTHARTGEQRTRRRPAEPNIVDYFGFYRQSKSEHHRIYCETHYILNLRQWGDGQSVLRLSDDPHELFDLVKQYRELCMELDVPMRSSASRFAAMMLKHPRFFPTARKKVGGHINAVAAGAKVGNYEWHPQRRPMRWHTIEFDQINSHHTAVSEMLLPDSNTMRPHGDYKELRRPMHPASALDGQHGIAYVQYDIAETTPDGVPTFDETRTKGTHRAWVGTNELDDWRKHGAVFTHVICAFVSRHVDTGLRDYAEWAMNYLQKKPGWGRSFFKQLLFVPYGLLGSKPHTLMWHSLRGDGDTKNLLLGISPDYPGEMLGAMMHTHGLRYPVEPDTVNQVWRAMIEREGRRRTITLARAMYEHGNQIVSITADSFIIREPYRLEVWDGTPTGWTKTERQVSFDGRMRYYHDTDTLVAPGLHGARRTEAVWRMRQLELTLR